MANAAQQLVEFFTEERNTVRANCPEHTPEIGRLEDLLSLAQTVAARVAELETENAELTDRVTELENK